MVAGVLSSAEDPTAALRFARFLAASDRGLPRLAEAGYQVEEGDRWAEKPEMVFFVGSVNRRAIEATVKEFQQREGCTVTTVYNGCGILTAQMKTIRDQQSGGFPDLYMACDVYYLENVKDWFQEAVEVSDNQIVMVVEKGNPKGIRKLADLMRPGVRVAVGQPDQCTIGALTRRMLQKEGAYDAVMKNVVTQTATSAMLVPAVTTSSADVALAYDTDARAETVRTELVRIDSSHTTAIQPCAIAKSSQRKQLARRLYQAIAASRERFESAGFHWRLECPVPGLPEEK
jgi:molybdenum ABC transporter molybdate-binding protein